MNTFNYRGVIMRYVLRKAIFAGLLATTGTHSIISAANADSSPAVTLPSCRAAALEAGDDPTRFPCNWTSVVRGAAGAALTGKYSLQQKGVNGTMTILEGGGGPALIGVLTVERASGQTCTVKTTAQRDSTDALTARPANPTGCSIKIVSSGKNLVRVRSEGCQAYCGARIGFDGTYKLITR